MVAMLGACGDDEGAGEGTEGGPCRPDGTCDEGLVCRSELCVAEGPCSPGATQPCVCEGGGPGTRTCAADETWQPCVCDCGNGRLDDGESCDGSALGDQTCLSVTGAAQGALRCQEDCTYDTTDCSTCGDGVVEGSEVCDGSALEGEGCASVTGHVSGVLTCRSDCAAYDTSQCHTCGDGNVEGPEICDGLALGAETCDTVAGHDAGALGCGEDCLAFDTSDCHTCGDGVAQGPEPCDGTDVAGATCAGEGYVAGLVSCSAQCQLDLGQCSDCGTGDLDQDGLSDQAEGCAQNRDSDADGIPDFLELDSDGDALTDDEEEFFLFTSPVDPDSDDDGVDDGTEYQAGTNPNGASDSPRSRGDLVFYVYPQATPGPSADTIAADTSGQSGSFDVSLEVVDDAGDTVDAPAEFLDYVEAITGAGSCQGGYTRSDTDSDGHPDTFVGVTAGETVCFTLVPRPNTGVPSGDSAAGYLATIRIWIDGATILQERDLYFVVPPYPGFP